MGTPQPRFVAGLSRRTAPLLIVLALLPACSSVSTLSATKPTPEPTQTTRPTAAAIPAAIFAFETAGPFPATWTFTDSNGTVRDAFTCTSSDGQAMPLSNQLNYVGGSTAILASSLGSTPTTKWTVIQANGTSTAVPASLTPILNTLGFPGIFLVAPSTLYAAQQVTNPKHPFTFLELNLTTGRVLESDPLVPLVSSRTALFEPENFDVSADRMSFLIANTRFENVTIGPLSVVTLNLGTKALTVHPLAASVAADILPPSGIPQYETTAYVSGDGSLLTYQTPTGSATYFLNVNTGRIATLDTDLNLTFIGGQNSVYYSPANQYAALIGADPAGTALRLVVVDPSTGDLVKEIDSSLPNAVQSAQLMGWADPTHVILSTNEGTYADTERTSLFDVETGKSTLFPVSTGQFIGVLR
jgi:hypothetical protein